MSQAPSGIFDYSHYFGNTNLTLGAERPILPAFDCVGFVLDTAPSSPLVLRDTSKVLVFPQEVYRKEIKPPSSYQCG